MRHYAVTFHRGVTHMHHSRMFCFAVLAVSLMVSPVANALAGAPCASASQAKSQGPCPDGGACCPHFTYTPGPHGPDHWGGVCNSGSTQSPINISHAVVMPLQPLEFGYQPGALSILNDCNDYRMLAHVA